MTQHVDISGTEVMALLYTLQHVLKLFKNSKTLIATPNSIFHLEEIHHSASVGRTPASHCTVTQL